MITMADFKFEPMRSFIYVDCADEDYRPKLQRWLYKTHIPDSIGQFDPYVTKYAFYPTFPIPPEGERFGYVRMQLTEHHWLVSDFDPRLEIKAIAETFPMEVLVWQGNLPASALEGMNEKPRTQADENANSTEFEGPELVTGDEVRGEDDGGDIGNEARQTNVEGGNPFIFCFCPMWWEDDIKGKGRNIEAGANYRFNVAFGYPEGVDKAEGDAWFQEQVLPIFENAPECTRILHSRVKKEINDCVMDHVYEFWFANQSAWHKVAVEGTKNLEKPAWAQQDQFPFLKPYHNVISGAVADFTMSDNLQNYHGYLPRR